MDDDAAAVVKGLTTVIYLTTHFTQYESPTMTSLRSVGLHNYNHQHYRPLELVLVEPQLQLQLQLESDSFINCSTSASTDDSLVVRGEVILQMMKAAHRRCHSSFESIHSFISRIRVKSLSTIKKKLLKD